MTLPPPDVCQRIAQLHAMMGSSSANEASTARDKLLKLLADHGCTWNDLGEILGAVRRGGRARATANGRSPAPLGGYFFHSPDGTAYADLHVNGHRQTWPVRSPAFQHHVRRQTFEQGGSPPTNAALREIVDQYEAEAQFNGPEREIHLRVGHHNGRAYLDLADDQWHVVEISADGWRVLNQAPVRFHRMPSMLALPVPVQGGSIEQLRELLNIQSRDDFILIVSWLLAALRGIGPYPVLAVSGEHGSAKSTLVRILRALIDPNVAPLRSLPTSERDLFVSADASFVQAYDNVSKLSAAISDALCRLSTGAAFASRQFFRNKGEVVISAMRPSILNGISHVIGRADLGDRTLAIALQLIKDAGRRPEAEVRARFESARPGILGALLDAVSRGLEELPQTKPTELARMADFDLWGRACEPALWPAGSFQRAYAANRREAVENSIEADAVAATIQKIVAARGQWQGTATDLLHLLEQYADDGIRRADRTWPRGPEALRHRLERARPNLRKVGIEITHTRAPDRGRDRLITISSAGPSAGADRPNRPNRPDQGLEAQGASDGSDGSDGLDAPFEGPKKTNGAAAESRVVDQPKGRPRARVRRKKKGAPAFTSPEGMGDHRHLIKIKFHRKSEGRP
jgi:hypothetical protein